MQHRTTPTHRATPWRRPALRALVGLIVALTLAAPPLAAQTADTAARAARPATAAPPAAQTQRLALVVGNGAYRDAPLLNPVNDARAMAAALQEAGFTVLLHTDVDQRALQAAVRDFGNRLRRGGGTGLFYFAGHGMQIKGRNYLVPVGADIQREDEVAYAALDAQAVLDKMETAGNGANLMILDACRNNPFARSFRSATQGLAPMDAPVGTLVAFATAPGSVASDGAASNGLYTQHLLTAMRRPGAKVEDVFKQVRGAVRRDSQGQQVPWEATSLEGDLYFFAPPATAAATDPALALDDAMWDAVRDSTDAADLRAYLRRFPGGRHIDTARRQLSALGAAAVSTAAAAAPAAATAATTNEGRDTAAHDQRTAELLGALARPASPPAALPAAASTAAAAPRRNAQGFAVGDRWNFQVIDRYRGEVVRNYGRRVARIEPGGGWVDGGGARYDEHGRILQWTTASGERRTMTPHGPRWWPGMQPGDARQFSYEEAGVPASGSPWRNRIDASARVLGRETVRVPAGEFSALRVEYRASITALGRVGAGTFTSTFWYVPELRSWVARDLESTWNGRPGEREREELTSFSLVDAARSN